MKAMLVSSCICDGQNKNVVNAIAAAIQQVSGVKLIDHSMEPNHNRSMFSFVGAIDPVLEASKEMALKAIELIDMRHHQGNHPRVGAVDAVPFIPVGDTKMSEAVACAHAFGKFMGDQKVPVWFYGEADNRTKISGANYELTQKALGEYENLPQQLDSKEWPPDEGPKVFNAKSGAATVGARGHLVSFNFNLGTDDLSIARTIAKKIRQSSGGLQNVFAIGLPLESKNQVQVSTMTDRCVDSPLPLMIKIIRDLAEGYGVSVCETEVAGTIPISIVEDVFKYYLQAHNFSPDQIVEKALID